MGHFGHLTEKSMENLFEMNMKNKLFYEEERDGGREKRERERERREREREREREKERE